MSAMGMRGAILFSSDKFRESLWPGPGPAGGCEPQSRIKLSPNDLRPGPCSVTHGESSPTARSRVTISGFQGTE
eukprot:748145-Hanusia_phi.AAC.1